MTTTKVTPGKAWAPHTVLPEPLLKFDSGPAPATHPHPLVGLANHGPYAAPPTGNIRVATITVDGQQQTLRFSHQE